MGMSPYVRGIRERIGTDLLLLPAVSVLIWDDDGRLLLVRGADTGTWQMIVLTGPTQIPVPPPAQVSSLDYQAELTAIKNAQGRLTKEQRKLIDYWSRGGVLRWNEIMLELVARADLPPAPAAHVVP